ncbi:hypothetical protein FQN60_004930 [Etheostoma spectabile]|uniref:Uncharacterized protein n=1 Tax=Etheostoma spectabile TaxID=54343 RepID=A0A5J5DL06_9PERO|nr:hypothetical protein FQN60_004930 [Etheostoma spectabile]
MARNGGRAPDRVLPVATACWWNTFCLLRAVKHPCVPRPFQTLKPELIFETVPGTALEIGELCCRCWERGRRGSPVEDKFPNNNMPRGGEITQEAHNAGAAIGGAVGGVALLAVAAILLFVFLRRRQRTFKGDYSTKKHVFGNGYSKAGGLPAHPPIPKNLQYPDDSDDEKKPAQIGGPGGFEASERDFDGEQEDLKRPYFTVDEGESRDYDERTLAFQYDPEPEIADDMISQTDGSVISKKECAYQSQEAGDCEYSCAHLSLPRASRGMSSPAIQLRISVLQLNSAIPEQNERPKPSVRHRMLCALHKISHVSLLRHWSLKPWVHVAISGSQHHQPSVDRFSRMSTGWNKARKQRRHSRLIDETLRVEVGIDPENPRLSQEVIPRDSNGISLAACNLILIDRGFGGACRRFIYPAGRSGLYCGNEDDIRNPKLPEETALETLNFNKITMSGRMRPLAGCMSELLSKQKNLLEQAAILFGSQAPTARSPDSPQVRPSSINDSKGADPHAVISPLVCSEAAAAGSPGRRYRDTRSIAVAAVADSCVTQAPEKPESPTRKVEAPDPSLSPAEPCPPGSSILLPACNGGLQVTYLSTPL